VKSENRGLYNMVKWEKYNEIQVEPGNFLGKNIPQFYLEKV